MSLLSLKDFSISFKEGQRVLNAVSDIALDIERSEMVALVGESGCGKSVTALSLMGLENERAITSGEILFEGKNIASLSESEWNKIRGESISMIFQEPMTALNPLLPTGSQVLEMVLTHQRVARTEAKEMVLDMFKSVGLADEKRIYKSYPHQLSGGQRQRIMIAMALINNPSLLIADEPTTALDVTIQAEIIELIKKMNEEKGTAVLLISHNLSLVKGLTDRSYIMYSGRIVEEGRSDDILSHPIHPYTRGLIASIPNVKNRGRRLYSIPGSVPSLEERSEQGCPFSPRCAICSEHCFSEIPEKRGHDGHTYSCFYSESEIEERMNG